MTTKNKKKEVEIKVELDRKDISTIKNELKKLGFRLIAKQSFETTFGFFTPDGSSIDRGIFPRIKVDASGAWLTVKVKKEQSKKYFKRTEFNLKVQDVDGARDVLKVLGYEKERIFEKFRDTYYDQKQKVEVTIDTLPFGYYMEIEGQSLKIEDMLKRLGLNGRERIVRAYLGVYDDWRKKHGVKNENAVFVKSKNKTF
ncbi:CYTH domain-containing protein [Candidatus Parcubacteria bacterium]|nr:CYTH domain-containing protein [Patescibacteria group bacterium]MBU4467021.1 CYTH domain-containing protein [Patescibacteria group bacterium]MCG2688680.1 CYTH domain-containing protein [Candidatus Parcubacteria bacterium]